MQGCEEALSDFVRRLIQVNSHTGSEKAVVQLAEAEMRGLGFEQVHIDRLGNLTGELGSGSRTLLFDSHLDVVEPGVIAEWSHDPFGAEVVDGKIYGRGSTDMKGGFAASVYGALAARDLGLLDGKRVIVSGSVMEEDYEGEALKRLFEEDELDVQAVVICEPSTLKLARGHKGRALIRVVAAGVSAHGSSPNLGENAVYKLMPVMERLQQLEEESRRKPEGGTWALTRVEVDAVSYNAIPGRCELYIDRRLLVSETREQLCAALDQLVAGTAASWEIVQLEGVSWTGERFVSEIFYPAWELSAQDELIKKGCRAYDAVLGEADDRFIQWHFSTNGVYTAGFRNIPTIGFGPGDPAIAHKVDEYCSVKDIVTAAGFYAAFINEF